MGSRQNQNKIDGVYTMGNGSNNSLSVSVGNIAGRMAEGSLEAVLRRGRREFAEGNYRVFLFYREYKSGEKPAYLNPVRWF